MRTIFVFPKLLSLKSDQKVIIALEQIFCLFFSIKHNSMVCEKLKCYKES